MCLSLNLYPCTIPSSKLFFIYIAKTSINYKISNLFDMYQQGLVNNDDARENFFNNQEYMPSPPKDKLDVFIFRKWNASSWVRPMYFLSLIIVALYLIVTFIYFVDSEETGIIFFGVVLILVSCGACLVFNRIIFELIMAFLQLPNLIYAMERLADTVQESKSLSNKPGEPQMTTGYQKTN
eukprot:43960_1